MKCISCGASMTPGGLGSYIKCNYCNTFTPNKIFLSNLTKSNLEMKQNEFEVLYEHEDYITLKDVTYSKIRKEPSNWIAYLYLAVAEYWLGKNDFKHLATVLNHLDKALQLSNNSIVVEYKQSLLNTAVSLASHNKIYGEELTYSLIVFDYIDQNNIEIDEEINLQRISYCNNAVSRLVTNIDQELLNKKNNFDITYINLKNLYRLAHYLNDLKIFEKFYLVAKFHLSKNKTKTYYQEINEHITKASEILRSKNSDVYNKNITFNFFGNLKIN